jgi:hypothetical protein
VRLYEHAPACVEAGGFADAARRGSRSRSTIDEAAKNVLVCLARVESCRTNRPVWVPTLTDIA